jgi:hydroxyacylglutathione hydrolase
MLKIIPIPAFNDNYIWTLHDNHHAIVVDPGDAGPVRAYLDKHQLKLSAILVTHHHRDHTGGILELVEVYNSPVYGPRLEKIPGLTHPLGEGDVVEIAALNSRLQVIDIPGHTRGHIAYLWDNSVFCGDTLFGCGCGKLFEGTHAQLHHSLQRLAALPDDTLAYCTHEYTELNLPFALQCEPDNARLKQREQDTHALREQNQPTLPFAMGLEKATNPFLRCSEPEVIRNIERKLGHPLPNHDQLTVFTAMRKLRDQC